MAKTKVEHADSDCQNLSGYNKNTKIAPVKISPLPPQTKTKLIYLFRLKKSYIITWHCKSNTQISPGASSPPGRCFLKNPSIQRELRPKGSCVITQWVSSTGSVRLLLPEEEEDPSPGAQKISGEKSLLLWEWGGGGKVKDGRMNDG